MNLLNRITAASLLLAIFAIWSRPSAMAADEAPDELLKMRASYEKDVEFALRPIRDRYVLRLETLKRSLGGRGDARGAAAVQDEIERTKDTAAQMTAKGRFEGLWSIQYENGVVRKVSIDANDMATMLTEGTVAKKLKAKLVIKGGEGVIDWGDGSIEKMAITDGKLLIDHFNPKSLYPKAPPSLRAVGTKTASK